MKVSELLVLEQFQQKCVAVLRAELRESKESNFSKSV